MGMNLSEIEKTDCLEVQKSQQVRLLDIFVFAPLLLMVAFHKQLKISWNFSVSVLIVLSVLTILYNWKNYIENERHDN